MNQALQGAQEAQGSLRATDKVAEDTWVERLVVVPQEQPEGLRPAEVVAWDLLDEKQIRTIPMRCLTTPLNEMQVIAFMVASGTCACCGIDGGRVHAYEVGDLCGTCSKGICDQRGLPCKEEQKDA